MAEEATAAPAGGETASVAVHSAGGDGPLSVRDAARSLTDWRNKQNAAAEQPEKQEESAEIATPAQESEAAPAAEDAAPPQEAPGETQEAEPAELPPIEPPRSWTKDARERWQSLPRETQEYLAEREQERDRELRRSQNEAADKLKGLTAKEQAAEQARQQYEAALPQLLNQLQNAQAGEFADIKSIDDVNKLASEDPLRFMKWQAHQMQIGAVENELKQSQQRQSEEKRGKLSKFITEQDRLFLEKAPELSDKKKAQAIADGAVSVLRDLGFSDEELGKSWMGEETLSLRDHRVQLLIRDAVNFREGEKNKAEALKGVAKKKLPPVQRPGAGKPASGGVQQEIKNLETQISKNPSGLNAIRLSAQLRGLRRQAAQ